MWPNEFVEIFGGMGLLGSLGLTGANANCASLCFVEIPEGTLGEGVIGDSVRVLRVFVTRRGTFGNIIGLGFALPVLDKDDLCSGGGTGFGEYGSMASSDESTENKDDGESGRGFSTAFSLP
jgi:hypothetical protein